MQSQISDAKNRLRDAAEYRSLVGSYFEQTVADAYELYERELVRFNAMDFDDLLVRAVNVLELFPEVRERYQQAFRHVLVDEYQDTNHAQYRWLTLLAGERRNLAVVGDDAQSIYGFRGADIRNILDFEQDFPDAHVVKLEQNYRSTQTILSAANAVIAHNRDQVRKDLWTELAPGDPIRIRVLADEHAEARSVLGAIERLVDEGVLALGDRRLLPHQRAVAGARGRARARRGALPGDRRDEVLRARRDQGRDRLPVAARQPADQVSFTRVANSPRRGHRPDLALARDRLRGDARRARLPRRRDGRDGARAWGRRRCARSAASWTRWASCARWPPTARRSPSCSRRVLSRSGYLDALEAERTFEAQGRIENLEELVGVAREFDARRRGASGLDAFLAQIALVADADTRVDDRGLVTLMTLHNAKGLEYPIVFIIGCEEGVFPHSRALDEGSLEEERRLCYVGITRAMRGADADLRAPARAVRRGELRAAQPLPRRDPRRADRPQTSDVLGSGARRIARGAGGGGAGGSWAAAAGRRPPPTRARRRDGAAVPDRRGCRPCGIRRGRRDGDRARRDRRRALRAATAPSASCSPGIAPVRTPVSARMIDGKAVAAALRARARRRGRGVRRRARPPAGPRDGADRRGPGERRLRRLQAARSARRSACARSACACRRRPRRGDRRVEELNADPRVNGIIVQLPVPDHLDGVKLTGLVDVAKDVDGLTPMSAGLLALGRPGLRPCTPSGVMLLLESVGAQLEGAEAVVIGRSNLFGKPMAQLLLARQRDGHDLPLAHRDLAGGVRARRRADRRDRAPADGAGRLGQARRDRHRRRRQPPREQARRRRRLRRRRASVAARSRRCRAASGR